CETSFGSTPSFLTTSSTQTVPMPLSRAAITNSRIFGRCFPGLRRLLMLFCAEEAHQDLSHDLPSFAAWVILEDASGELVRFRPVRIDLFPPLHNYAGWRLSFGTDLLALIADVHSSSLTDRRTFVSLSCRTSYTIVPELARSIYHRF